VINGYADVLALTPTQAVLPQARRPLVITADAVLEWLNADTSPQRAEEIAHDAAIPAKEFTWHPVSKAVGNIHSQGKELIEQLHEATD